MDKQTLWWIRRNQAHSNAISLVLELSLASLLPHLLLLLQVTMSGQVNFPNR